MLSTRITACVFAFNEERRLEEAVRNFTGVFPILVVDNFSTDGTREVAARLNIPVVQVRNPGFIETPEVMDAVQAAVATDYVLIASCAEVVPATLLKLYADVAESGSHDVVRALRISITAGLPIPISGKPDRQAHDARFAKKGSIDYRDNQVHHVGRMAVPPERVWWLPRDRADLVFYQFRDYDCSKTENALCRYDDVLARQRFEAGETFSMLRCLYRSLGLFFVAYVRNGCYRFGMLGFIHSAYRAIMEFTIHLRIWEHQHAMTLTQVIARNDVEKSRLLREIDALGATTPPNRTST